MQTKFLVLNIPYYYYYFFTIFILFLVVVNQLYFKIKVNLITIKDDLLWSILYLALGFLFGLLLFFVLKYDDNYGLLVAKEATLQYFTGYILEKSLSIDNMFVILMIFSYFKVNIEYQHKVLSYGLIGVIVLRLIFIFLGVTLINRFFWVVYILGFFLIYSGVSIFYKKEENSDYSNNYIINKLTKFIPISNTTTNRFLVKEDGVIHGTNLLLSLIIIELSDIVFAVDSISAIFSVSMDKFIIFTSNIFAVLGLRSLYFLLANIVLRYVYLKYAISVILIFVGIKILIHDIIDISVLFSLLFILICFIVSIFFSILKNKKDNKC